MQTENTKINYPQKIARIILKVILFLFLFIVVLFLLLLTPPVQKFATGKVESFLQHKLKTKVEIGSISIGLPRKVVLNDIYLEDQTKDTLLYGGSIKANIALFKLLSSEVQVKSLELTDVTAKIKRVLPDTAFNFQFIVDAFAPTAPTQPVDTTAAQMKMEVDDVALNNCRVVYKDVITGNDMAVHVGSLEASIDSLNPYELNYDIGTVDIKNVVAVVNQSKPLLEPEPLAKDMAEAAEPTAMKLNFDKVNLDNVNVTYGNDVSAFYTRFNIGKLLLDGRQLDLQRQIIHFDELRIDNTTSAIRLGKKEEAKVAAKEIKKEVQVQQQQNNWIIRVDKIALNDNNIAFDNDNEPKLRYGMDYAHLKADSLTLHAENFVMNTDSIGLLITKGSFREKSGFQLEALQGDLLYASNQTYLKNLYIKTPGTELQRDLVLEYASYDALVNKFGETIMNIDIPHSRIQVKDILTFAPQLRTNPAFSRPNEVWHLNLKGSGSMNRLYVEALQFSGLGNTQIDASGTLASLSDPNQAGGTFTIRRLHTTQSDIAMLTGQSLAAMPIKLPQTVDINGTLSGNATNLITNLNINTSAGFMGVNGRFSNLTNPAAATYNATVRTAALQLGSILQNGQVGTLNATLTASGRGFTPDAINTSFKGNIYSFGFNNYTYRNVSLHGNLNKTAFNATVDANDPNIDLNLTAKGNFSKTPSFQVSGMIDSIKTLPLHFTTQPLVFRGAIEADIPSADPNNLQADVMIRNALLVSGTDRLAMDTIHLLAGRSDTGQYISLISDVINAKLTGQYQLAELGSIIQNNIQPYFSTTPTTAAVKVQPYDITFRADMVYDPILSVFVPGLTAMEPLHAEGRLATGQGMQATATSSHIVFGTNEISDLDLRVNTADSGMQIRGTVARLKSGSSFDLYNTQLNATALNNNIDFNLRVGDKNNNNKYLLSGLFTQPTPGNMTIHLRPDSLLLNYDRWSITPDNAITITPEQILANNFVLQKGGQQLSIISAPGSGIRPLNVSFNDFRLGTITGFIKADSLLIDGAINGSVSFKNLMQQPVFTSDLTISNLSFKQDTIGNIALKVASAGNNYNADVRISGFGNDVQLTGSFAPQGKDIALDLDLAVRRLELSTLEGAMATFVKKATGAIDGNVRIGGTSSQPKIQGALNFDSAAISTAMLGGPLMINDEKLQVTENGFVFDNFSIRDSANNALTLDGTVSTVNFINYNFDLNVNAKNFKAVNSTRQDNKIYYGDLVLSTRLHIGGTEQKPVVDGSLNINEGTQFTVVIPQTEPGVVQREGVVQFIDFDAPGNDSLFLAPYDSLNTSSLVGFDITTNITIDKEASFNIVVDEANGDFLNIKGSGQLSAGIDPSGKITLTGQYEIEEGAYQLSFNFLQRRFDIQKGSKIIWLGEPTQAQLDVTAVYIANTAPLDLVGDQLGQQVNRNYYRQKLPFQVKLNLDGELMKPLITFDIVLPTDKNYGVNSEVVSTVNQELTRLRQQPSELNKQVFAVLLLNRFVGQNPFESSGGGGGMNAESIARQSASKLLTEQLNNLAAGLVGGVDINFDVASTTDDYTTGERRTRTDLNVGVSKRLLNDRLKVTVGSNFQLEGTQQANQSSNNIAGNVAVDYQLSKDGRYMVRFYRKNEYEGNVDGYVIETGLGFIMTVDYNRFRDILHGRRNRNQRQDNNQNKQQ